MATIWQVRLRASAVEYDMEGFDDETRIWSWKLAQPLALSETSTGDLYCGYRYVPISRRVTGSKVLRYYGQE